MLAAPRDADMFICPEPPFVRLRLPNGTKQCTLTFSAPPLAASSPSRPRLHERKALLAERGAEVMAWMERNSAHTQLFARDPQAALRLALPDLPDDFFQGWCRL